MTLSITIKTLQQKQFKVDAEPTETVAQLKEKIEQANGSAVAQQKLIYSGKILADDKVLGDLNIKEKDFLVLMVAKPKATPAASTSTTGPSTASTSTSAPLGPPPADQVPPAPVPAPQEPAIQPPPTAAVSDAPAAASEAPAFGDASAFVTGSAMQTAVQGMVDMGFPREQVMLAMRASFNNPDRAVEYLMTGIPDNILAEMAPAGPAPSSTAQAAPAAPNPAPVNPPTATAVPPSQPGNLFQAAQQAAQQGGAGAAGRGAGRGPAIDLGGLQNNPAFGQIQQMVQQNPALLQPLIQQLATNNPGLGQALAENPELLYQILGGIMPGAGAAGAGGEGDDFDDEGGPIPPGAQVISVTEEERAAIERLTALGFPRQAAIEAYFACGKNEELAANFLFENNFD